MGFSFHEDRLEDTHYAIEADMRRWLDCPVPSEVVDLRKRQLIDNLKRPSRTRCKPRVKQTPVNLREAYAFPDSPPDPAGSIGTTLSPDPPMIASMRLCMELVSTSSSIISMVMSA